jgi:hypothetical protein
LQPPEEIAPILLALIFVSATQAQSAGSLNNSDLAGDWTSGTP